VADLEGDGLLDLVVTGEAVFDRQTGGTRRRVTGALNRPEWLVFRNLGDRFAAAPSEWSLPEGGEPGGGFWTLGGGTFDEGSDQWSLLDLEGDGRADLVVTGRTVADRSGRLNRVVLGGTGAPFWQIFPNRP